EQPAEAEHSAEVSGAAAPEPQPAETAEPLTAETEAEPAATETEAAPEAAEAEAEAAPGPVAPLRPGDVVESRIAVWATEDAEGFRVRIREAVNLFVDDPGSAVTTAAAVVTDAVNALAAALQAQHAELDPDTESLRVAILRYRELLDRVLTL